jgi:uncharacterized repeat protein (TIGR03803 family)
MSPAKVRQAFLLLWMGLALAFAACAAQAQTETVLYNFCSSPGCPDGLAPDSRLTSDEAVNFYGMTANGGLGYGTVFELSPNGRGGWNETVLYSFSGGQNGPDGDYPGYYSDVIFDSSGNLYGTTLYGGAEGLGMVFELSRAGTSWTETVLHSFTGGTGDGAYPSGDLAIDVAGNVYGTTSSGGSAGGGIVFELSPSGGVWNEQVIYDSALDKYGYDIPGVGMAPGLAMDTAGNLYGANGDSVIELSPNGNGGWNSAMLHTFTGAPDDNALEGYIGTPVLDQAGNIYGTTIVGGPWGITYKLSPEKKGKWKEKVIAAFNGIFKNNDGVSPGGALVISADGNIYGVSDSGGQYGTGVMFELIPPAGTGKYEHKTLWIFGGPGDGWLPRGGLIQDSAGNLYGTTIGGGSNDGGIVFEITP